MTSRTELNVEYDSEMRPVSATCTGCGEKMPQPPANLQKAADIIGWLSEKYVEHRKLKRSQDDRGQVPRD
jgi:hypothetical protein